MMTLTKKEIRKAIVEHLPANVEMAHTTSIKDWLLANVFDYNVWIRDDYCGIVVKSMTKEGLFHTFRSPTGTIIYIKNA